jgi:hypothetical protein
VKPVKVTLDFEQFGSAGESPCQPQAVHGRFSARAGEPDALAAWDDLTEEASEVGVQLIFVRTGRSTSQHCLDGLAHAAVAMAEHCCSVAATQVDVFATVQIPKPAAIGPVKQHGMAHGPIQADGRGDPSGQVLAGLFILVRDFAHLITPGRLNQLGDP